MGRRKLSRSLGVWMNGERVGTWSVSSSGIHELKYSESWLVSPNRRPISLSLPLIPSSQNHSGHFVESFFDNLLPDSTIIRKRIQARYGKLTDHTFDLLEEIGRDCVGAIQLLPEDIKAVDVRKVSSREVDEEEMEYSLLSMSGQNRNFQIDKEEFRISIAGVQEKTSFLRYRDRWHIPKGTTPSTHIFKLPIGPLQNIDMSSSVENEWISLKLFKAFGIPAANADIMHFGSQKVLVVERFDRKISDKGDWIIRLPQEDMCQALGISPGLKYESDGGPGITEVLNLLLGSDNFEEDRRLFFKTQILFWLLAAPDGHAKNFSIILAPEGKFALAPVYDVLSAYPILGRNSSAIAPQKLKMAMAVYGKNKHYLWSKIQPDHWLTTSIKNGLNKKVCRSIIDEILSQSEGALESVYKEMHKDISKNFAALIIEGFSKTLKQLN